MKIWQQTILLFENEKGELTVSSIKLELVSSKGVPDISINELRLGVRIDNILRNYEIKTIRDLVVQTEREMLRIKGLGRYSFDKVRHAIEKLGLHFGMKLNE